MRTLLGYLLFGLGAVLWTLGFFAGWYASDWDLPSLGAELTMSFLGGMLTGFGWYLVLGRFRPRPVHYGGFGGSKPR